MNFKNIFSKYTKGINIEIRGINILIHFSLLRKQAILGLTGR